MPIFSITNSNRPPAQGSGPAAEQSPSPDPQGATPNQYSGAQSNLNNVGILSSEVALSEVDNLIDQNSAFEDQVQQMADQSQGIQIIGRIVEIQNDENISESLRASLLDCISSFVGNSGTSGDNSDVTVEEESTGGNNVPAEVAADIQNFMVRKLVNRNDIDAFGTTIGEGFADLDMRYNYSSAKYEDFVENESPSETIHPNFSSIAYLGEEDNVVNEGVSTALEYEEALSRDVRTYFSNLRSAFFEDASGNQKLLASEVEPPVASYYREVYDALLREDLTDNFYSDAQEKNKTQYIYSGHADTIREKKFLQEHFPFFLNIEVSSFPAKIEHVEPSQQASNALWKTVASLAKDKGASDVLMRAAVVKARTVEPNETAVGPFGEDIKIWDFPLSYSEISTVLSSDITGIAYLPAEFTTPDSGYDSKVAQIPNNHKVTETLMFKICKYEQGSEEALQEFYIYNDETSGPVTLVDTQINIGKTYQYRIFSYELVYSVVDGERTTHLVEYEAFRQDNLCLSNKPPMPPDVNIAPYMGNENDILFLFNDSSGKALLEPVQIDDEDAQIIQRMLGTHGKKVLNPDISQEDFYIKSDKEKFKTLIEYEYDESSELFEVFRTDSPPMSYQDFKGKKLATAAGTSYKDRIAPNKKYYYTFRCKDGHGSLSNPSAVFEVEIVKTFNVFPNIRVYEFPDEVKETREVKRKAKKFLRISPDVKFLPLRKQDETSVPNSAFDTVKDSYTMGLNNITENLWNKKFKLRLTSKTSGRKIDFNFSFTKSFIENTKK